MKKLCIRIFQLFILLVIRLVFFGRVKTVISQADAQISGPIVIAANHANELDPFIIACFLPLRTIFKVFPYKFMTANIYYYRWWKPLAFLAGCYPAKPKDENARSDSYGVGQSIAGLQEGYSIVMFPEGKRTAQRIEAKPGISRILEGSDARLLLCRIVWGLVNHPRLISLSLKAADTSLEATDPDAIMDTIYSLSYAEGVAPVPQKL